MGSILEIRKQPRQDKCPKYRLLQEIKSSLRWISFRPNSQTSL